MIRPGRSTATRRFCISPWPSTGLGGRPPGQEAKRLSQKELNDNLTFLSALRLLEQLTAKGVLNTEEAQQARAELEQRLRPTLLFV